MTILQFYFDTIPHAMRAADALDVREGIEAKALVKPDESYKPYIKVKVHSNAADEVIAGMSYFEGYECQVEAGALSA